MFSAVISKGSGQAPSGTTYSEVRDLADAVAAFRKNTSEESGIPHRRRLCGVLRTLSEGAKNVANQPEWMILDVLPVIRRISVHSFRSMADAATSDLNELYRRVINRNNRLKKLIDIKGSERDSLQREAHAPGEAVDQLFDSGRRRPRRFQPSAQVPRRAPQGQAGAASV